MQLEYINIDKYDLPYEFSINIEGETYTFLVEYNMYGDFFTIEMLYDDIPIRKEKIVYGKSLFNEIPHHPLIPLFMIIPYSITRDDIDKITYENFNESVFLYIFSTDYIEEVLPDE